jgi:hypothetical protein
MLRQAKGGVPVAELCREQVTTYAHFRDVPESA